MDDERRKAPRTELPSTVEFVVDDHTVFEARGVDVSEAGVGFETDGALEFALNFEIDGEATTRRARLIRVNQTGDGSFSFGLEFLEDEDSGTSA